MSEQSSSGTPVPPISVPEGVAQVEQTPVAEDVTPEVEVVTPSPDETTRQASEDAATGQTEASVEPDVEPAPAEVTEDVALSTETDVAAPGDDVEAAVPSHDGDREASVAEPVAGPSSETTVSPEAVDVAETEEPESAAEASEAAAPAFAESSEADGARRDPRGCFTANRGGARRGTRGPRIRRLTSTRAC